jgi:transcriptional regulator with XRE-family HTH domain
MHHLGGVINIKNKALVKAVGERIREIRLKQGISQEALSHEADIPLSQIGRIERGETNPTISTLYVIAQALGTELTLLVDVQLKEV